jgi:hypothetical protein
MWLRDQPLLLLLPAILLAAVWGLLLTEYGVADLFWHERPLLALGAGVGLFWAVLAYLSYLLRAATDRGVIDRRREAYWAVVVLLLLCCVPPVVYSASGFVSWGARVTFIVGSVVAVVVFWLVVVVAFDQHWWLARLQPNGTLDRHLPAAGWVRRPMLWARDRLTKLTQLDEFKRARRQARNLFLVVALAFAVLAVLNRGVGLDWGAGLTIGLVFALTATALGAIQLYYPRWFWVVIALGVVWFGVMSGLRRDPDRIPGLEAYYQLDDVFAENKEPADPETMIGANKPSLRHYDSLRKLPQLASQTCKRQKLEQNGVFFQLDDERTLRAWAEQFKPTDGPPKPQPLIVVTTSGGASVSAIFTLTFLTELERQKPGSSKRIRILTGASGGMLGAAYFRARRSEFDPLFNDPEKREALIADMRTRMRTDFLSPVVQQTVFKDLPMSWLCPSGYVRNRGWRLERAWDKALLRADGEPALALTFRQMRTQEVEGREPSMIFSPMMVEDGRPLLISTLDLDRLLEQKEQGGKRINPITPVVEFFKLFPKGGDVTLGTAVRLNASFPFISPASVVPTVPPRRLVDAGYYDNHGVDTAVGWLMVNEDALRHLVDDHLISKVIVIQLRPYLRLDNFATEDAPAAPLTPAEFDRLATADTQLLRWRRSRFNLDELLTPVAGGTSALRSSMQFRQATQLKLVQDRFNEQKLIRNRAGQQNWVSVDVYVYTFMGNLDASLNWYLPQRQIEEIEGSITPLMRDGIKNKEEYDNLRKYPSQLPYRYRDDLAQKPAFRAIIDWNTGEFERLIKEFP